MAITNSERIGRGLEILRSGLAPFVEQEMKAVHGSGWQQNARQSCVKDTDWKVVAGKVQWEVYLILMVLWDNWNGVFKRTLGHAERNYVSELREVRKQWAHQ